MSVLEGPKEPPFNLDAEAAVLGACMLDPKAVDQVLDLLQQDDFYRNAHQKTFQAIKDLHQQGKDVDLVMVQDWLGARGLLDIAGGPVALAGMTERVASAANVEAYARVVLQHSKKRRLISLAGKLTSGIYGAHHDPELVAEEMAEQLHGFIVGAGEAMDAHLCEPDEEDQQDLQALIDGKRLGFEYEPWNLYTVLGPVLPGRVMVLGGRPGVGKSSMLLHIGLELAKRQVPIYFASIEMTLAELRAKAAAWLDGCDSRRLLEGPLETKDVYEAKRAWEKLRQWPFRASHIPGLTVSALRARVRTAIRKHGVKVVLVDYLQLLQTEQPTESEYQQVTIVTRVLSLMAKELNVAVIVTAQLNRGSEKSTEKDRELKASDLRSSGQIEQDAHVIALLRLDGDAISDPEPTLMVNVVKRRMGPTGRAELKFIRARSLLIKPEKPEPQEETGA